MAKKKAAKKPRQKRLPGMADAKIEALQSTALDYAEIRDQRIELIKQEAPLKERLIKLMHKYNKTEYVFQGVSVKLVAEEENVKVKIQKPKEDDEPSQVEVSVPEPTDEEEGSEPDLDGPDMEAEEDEEDEPVEVEE